MVPKFRGKTIKGFLVVGYVSVVTDKRCGVEPGTYISNSVGLPFAYEVIPETVGQSTGLKDKNGVEIFEGDVLTSNVQPCKMVNPIKDGYGVVRFENGMFKLGAISLVTFISKMEVIGNVWENPNLLEQANEN